MPSTNPTTVKSESFGRLASIVSGESPTSTATSALTAFSATSRSGSS